MPRPPRLPELLRSLVVAGLALSPAGCPSPEERTCDLVCDCTGCSEARYLDCLDRVEAARQDAAAAGCSGAFDAYTTCFQEEIECRDEALSNDGCEDQEDDLRACGVFVFRSVCEIAMDRVAACGFSAPASAGRDECVGLLECNSRCIVEASCDGLSGADPEENLRVVMCTDACP